MTSSISQISLTASPIDAIHGQHIAKRRARVLSEHLADLIPQGADVLDVGCGDGEIAWTVSQSRPDISVRGVDVLVRPDTCIPVEAYDGLHLPLDDDSCDVVTLIDVLHHCDDARAVLREAARVARRAIVIKDHTRDGFAAERTLRLMDWVGNHRYGVALPYNYLSRSEWRDMFADLGLRIEVQRDALGLYAWPVNVLFERGLHFAARLAVPTVVPTADAVPEETPVPTLV